MHARPLRRYGDQGGQGGLTHVAQLLEELSEFPIAGCYEDVMWEHDMVGYEELRRRANRPIGLHHFPLVSSQRAVPRFAAVESEAKGWVLCAGRDDGDDAASDG